MSLAGWGWKTADRRSLCGGAYGQHPDFCSLNATAPTERVFATSASVPAAARKRNAPPF